MEEQTTQKQLLLGYDDFCDFIENNGFFVDKSLLIKELIDYPNKVTLITRPRRFGKTINMSMLKYFWEIPECRRNEENLNRDIVAYQTSGDFLRWNADQQKKN